jgi:hypothetical protein
MSAFACCIYYSGISGDRMDHYHRIRYVDARCRAIAYQSLAKIAKASTEHGLLSHTLARRECGLRTGDR